MNQAVQGADAKEEGIEEEAEEQGRARSQEYDIWERGGGRNEELVINSFETHIGVPINAAIHLSGTQKI